MVKVLMKQFSHHVGYYQPNKKSALQQLLDRERSKRKYKPTEGPPPITLPTLKFLEEKDDG